EQIVGSTAADLIGGERFKNKVKPHLDRCMAGEHLRYEIQIDFPGEGKRWMRMEYVPFRDENETVTGVVSHGIDITERKQMEEALRESEYRKNLILNSTSEMVAYYDTDLRILWANRAAAQSVGKSVEEMIGGHCYEIWHQRTEPCPDCPILRALDQKTECEGTCETPDGREWYLRGYPVFDDAGNIVGLVEFGQDITEKQETRRAIAAEKERLAVTLRSIGDGVITTDTAGMIIILNKAAENITGWTQEQAAGKPLTTVFNIVNEFTRKPCANPVQKVLETGRIIELSNHTMLITRNGDERIIADSGAPIKDDNGITIGVVLVFRDTTEKQRLLDQMRQTDKLDSLGVLAGGIAHDFNNLLGGIFGYLDMARECSTENKTASGYLDKALSTFNRAKDLTQQLLTFSKGGAPVRKTGNIATLVRENVSFVLVGSNIACDYDIPENVWPCDYDENQIGQVVDNIVMNAQQAMPMGGRIIVSLRNVEIAEEKAGELRPGKYVCFSVSDKGVGIPPEIIGRIFDPFFTTKQKGGGLGLATCYSIVRKHDGEIKVESSPGKGATFNIYLPASDKHIIQTAQPPIPSVKGTGVVLVMDDEDFVREVAGAMLKPAGFEILEAENGEQALRFLTKAINDGKTITAAILDLTIPGGKGGKETVLEIQKVQSDIPVFASSGYSEDPVMARPREFGFVDSIRKPYRKRELYEMLSRNLGSRA
ncbi:MAG: PAS domain-containing protein, partial [Chitinivibrionales bacterium]|nr:PAS domain-containing protein [Chitinivibrionales bacterium]